MTQTHPLVLWRIVSLLAAFVAVAGLSGCITSYPEPGKTQSPMTTPRSDTLADDAVAGGDPAPTWTLQTVVANARYVSESRYTVKRGDTLLAIGERSGAGAEAIAIANSLSDPFLLLPGQRLHIPAGLYHHVSAGETGIAIARAYGVKWSQVATINQLAEPFILRIGQRVRLPPSADARKASTIADRAARFTIEDIVTGSQPAVATPSKPIAAPPGKASAIVPPSRFSARFQWPVEGPVIARFGRLAPGKVNDGINIATTSGTPVKAAAKGIVSYAGDEFGFYGGLILISHGSGWVSAYGHAASLAVRRGQKVEAGDIIARAGASGQVQSPQLHFQLRKNRIAVNPVRYLPKR